jgi:Poly A polymerase head domain
MTGHADLKVFRPPHLLTSPLRNYLANGAGEDLSLLRSNFPKNWSIYIMGGLLRNLLLEELRALPMSNADVDLVINGASSSAELRDRLRHYCIRQNEFGGAKCRVSATGIVFDVWRIEDHVGMSSTASPRTVEQLLRHNLLDVDAILLDLKTDQLYDYGCLAAIRCGKISLLGKEGISEDFATAQAAHIILIAFKTRFELSNGALQLVREICETAKAKSDVIRIVYRKMPAAGESVERFLDELLKEELWPAMTA